MSKEINFTLLSPLGMKVLEKCVVGEVHAGGQVRSRVDSEAKSVARNRNVFKIKSMVKAVCSK